MIPDIDTATSEFTETLSEAEDYREPVWYCSLCDDAISADSCLYYQDEPYCSEGCISEDIENNR